MSMAEVSEGLAMMSAGYAKLAAAPKDPLTTTELISVYDQWHTLMCQMPTQGNKVLTLLQRSTTAREMGAKSWKDFLAVRWRLSTSEANRRLTEAALLGPRHGMTGEPLEPELAATAAAVALGAITAEHVAVIRKAIKRLPSHVGAADRTQIEVDWVRIAAGAGPKDLEDAADLTLFLLDQDGPEPDDAERARKRGFTRNKQGRDGTVAFSGTFTPEAWATLEPLFGKYAAPGMCNPDDPEPCTSGTPSQAQIDNDHRSLAQRQHDAIVAVGRIALMSDQVGKLNGLPVSMIIRTTIEDLESRAGIGVTGGGTKMPIKDVIRLAAHANHYLAVFDGATGSAMDLFRSKRVASADQRIMLTARDGGCTKPCCTVGAYGCQVHHVVADWVDDGQTNVDDLGLACGPDNRMVDRHGGWTTRMTNRHDVEWIPPEHLDNGQTRINTYHRPEILLRPPQDQPASEGDAAEASAAAEPDRAEDCPSESSEPCDEGVYVTDTVESTPPEPGTGMACAPAPSDPWAIDNPVDPVEPTPRDPNFDETCDLEPFDPWADLPVESPTEHDTLRAPELFDPWGDDYVAEPVETEPVQNTRRSPELLDPWRNDSPAEPGGPAPPDEYPA